MDLPVFKVDHSRHVPELEVLIDRLNKGRQFIGQASPAHFVVGAQCTAWNHPLVEYLLYLVDPVVEEVAA